MIWALAPLRDHDITIGVAHVARDFRGESLPLRRFAGVDSLFSPHGNFRAGRQRVGFGADRRLLWVLMTLVAERAPRGPGAGLRGRGRPGAGLSRLRGRQCGRIVVFNRLHILHRQRVHSIVVTFERDFAGRGVGDVARVLRAIAHHDGGVRSAAGVLFGTGNEQQSENDR